MTNIMILYKMSHVMINIMTNLMNLYLMIIFFAKYHDSFND